MTRTVTMARLGILTGLLALGGAAATAQITLTKIGGYDHGGFEEGAAEISAYDHQSARLFVVNAEANRLDILDLSTPSSPQFVTSISLDDYGAGINSVAVRSGLVAVAVEASPKQDPGKVVFLNTAGTILSSVTVGALPDMLTFTPNGQYVLVANEGEPNSAYTVDPEGSISVIDVKGNGANITQDDVRTAGFTGWTKAMLPAGVRIFGPNATVAQDLEPEYIAVSENSQTAWVTLQENNAIAIIDLKRARVTSIVALGLKNHMTAGNGLDPSDRDNAIAIGNWPVYGMYMPDGIAAYRYHGDDYILLANEGDARDYSAYAEEIRVGSSSYKLDPTRFPNAAALKANGALGRLTVSKASGDLDNDGDYDEIHVLGARSISIRNAAGALVFDSGDDFEQITASLLPSEFNSNNDENGSFDTRSDNKGPEPEGIDIGKIEGRTYAFIGLERIGGVMVYDVTNPTAATFVTYVNSRDFDGDAEAGTAGDLGPEGILFIEAGKSPNGRPLLVVANEISGTTAIFEIGSALEKRGVVAGELATTIAPNPASTSATMSLDLREPASIGVAIVAPGGEVVASLEATSLEAGTRTIELPIAGLAAGRYFVRIEQDGHTREIRPLVIVR